MTLQAQQCHRQLLLPLMVEVVVGYQRTIVLVQHLEEAPSNENPYEDPGEGVIKVQRKYKNLKSNEEQKQTIGNAIGCRC